MLKIHDFNGGTTIKQLDYKAFLPSKINNIWSWNDHELTRLVEK